MDFDRTILRMVKRINKYDQDRNAWMELINNIDLDKDSMEYEYFLEKAKVGTRNKFRSDLKKILIEEYNKDKEND